MSVPDYPLFLVRGPQSVVRGLFPWSIVGGPCSLNHVTIRPVTGDGMRKTKVGQDRRPQWNKR